MIRLLFIFLLFHSIRSSGQIDSALQEKFRLLPYSSEYSNLTYDSFTLSIDSIQVTVKYNSQKIITENIFTKSRRTLTITYYFKNDSLFYVETSEICPLKAELECNSNYFIANDTISQQGHSSKRQISHGAYSLEEIAKAHFCPSRLDYVFLEKYIWILLEEIRQAHF